MRVIRKPGKLHAIKQAAQSLTGERGRVGWFPSAVYEDGKRVASVAYDQEFGNASRRVPPRMGLRAMTVEKKPQWKTAAADISKAVIQGHVDPARVMEVLTAVAEGHAREQIASVTSPPLREATIAARKRRLANGGKGAKASIAKPLVDTGVLLNTLTSETGKK